MGVAGRPKGSTTRPQIRDYLTKKQIQEFALWVIEQYKEKPELAKWLGDHIFGKAVQPLGNDERNPLIIEFHKVFNADTTPQTKGDNSK